MPVVFYITSFQNVYMQKTLIATASYTVSTFALAIAWHIVLFEEQYKVFNYIEAEPNFALGFSTILIQAIVLSAFYAKLREKMNLPALHYAGIMGVFFWSSHVLAFIAKQDIQNVLQFAGMETVYLVLQFGLYGFILRWLYRNS